MAQIVDLDAVRTQRQRAGADEAFRHAIRLIDDGHLTSPLVLLTGAQAPEFEAHLAATQERWHSCMLPEHLAAVRALLAAEAHPGFDVLSVRGLVAATGRVRLAASTFVDLVEQAWGRGVILVACLGRVEEATALGLGAGRLGVCPVVHVERGKMFLSMPNLAPEAERRQPPLPPYLLDPTKD
jgi:hypothetical protein